MKEKRFKYCAQHQYLKFQQQASSFYIYNTKADCTSHDALTKTTAFSMGILTR